MISIDIVILDTWKNYFAQPLNIQTVADTSMVTYHIADIRVQMPTLDNIKSTIKSLRNNKAPCCDSIPSELLKYGSDTLNQQLYLHITTIWQEKQLPVKWKECVIIPIHKTGNKMVCPNYRGISLFNTASAAIRII